MTTTEVISNQYKQKFEFINFRNGRIFDFSVLLICCLSFGFSWIESILNYDSHHWGFMYVQALDLKRGLIPYKETFPAYGIMTTWIQSLSLTLFGERLISIGIATGIFYSFSLFLSYQLFLQFLPKYAAFFSTLLIFLLNGYIVFPWSNYFCYTFFLLSLLMFFTKKNHKNVFGSGLLLGFSLLCRYTSFQAILPPFVFFFIYEFIFQKNTKKTTNSRLLFFGLGFLFPILLFLLFLFSNSLLDDFWIQNQIMTLQSKHELTISNFLPNLFKSIFITSLDDVHDSRMIFFTIIFCWNFVTLFYFLKKLFLNKNLAQNEAIVMEFCLVTLFGYLNAIHSYDLFRLINGSSLGVGVIIYSVIQTSQGLGRKIKIIILLPLISICFILANSLIFSALPTSAVYTPWRLDILIGKGVISTEISIFKGKLLKPEYYNFYRDIYQHISKFDHSHYIINYTLDPVAMIINNLPKVQMASIYFPLIEQAYPEEAKRIQQIINTKKAVILSDKDIHLPGYKVIFSKTWLSGEVPWLSNDSLAMIYISVPEETEM
ncbi:MAG: glycosyltransferase family 39 protein [Nostoc sp.]